MPISLDSSGDMPVIRISGVTPPDEADELLAMLRENPEAPVDLSELEHLHTALLQMMHAAKVSVVVWPLDGFWRKCFRGTVLTKPEPAQIKIKAKNVPRKAKIAKTKESLKKVLPSNKTKETRIKPKKSI